MRDLQAASFDESSLVGGRLLLSVDPSVSDFACLAAAVSGLTFETMGALAGQGLPMGIQGRLAGAQTNPFGDIDGPAAASALSLLVILGLGLGLIPLVTTNLHLEISVADGARADGTGKPLNRRQVETLGAGELEQAAALDVVADEAISIMFDPAAESLGATGTLVVVPHGAEEELAVDDLGSPGLLDGDVAGSQGDGVVHVELL